MAILQGPVAVSHSRSVDETAGDILGGIESGLIKRLVQDVYGGDESKIPMADYLGSEPQSGLVPETLEGLKIKYESQTQTDQVVHTYDIDGVLPPPGPWLKTIANGPGAPPKSHWLSALLNTLSVVVESSQAYVSNPTNSLLKPRHSQRVQVTTDLGGNPLKVKVFGALRNPIVT